MKKWLQYLIVFLCSVAMVLLVLFGSDAFHQSGEELLKSFVNAFFTAGIIVLGLGLLVLCTAGGTFDMIAFGVIKLFDLFKKDLTKVKYRTFYDYRKAQQEKQRSYWHYIVVGGAFTLVSIVLLVILNNM